MRAEAATCRDCVQCHIVPPQHSFVASVPTKTTRNVCGVGGRRLSLETSPGGTFLVRLSGCSGFVRNARLDACSLRYYPPQVDLYHSVDGICGSFVVGMPKYENSSYISTWIQQVSGSLPLRMGGACCQAPPIHG